MNGYSANLVTGWSNSLRRGTPWLLLCVITAGVSQRAPAGLPAENSWPGESRRPQNLPDESQWPGDPPVSPPSVPSVPEVTPPGQPPDELTPLVADRGPSLPSESTWPVAMQQRPTKSVEVEVDPTIELPPPLAGKTPDADRPPDETTPADQNDPLAEARSKAADERPWLRLQSRGPIAPVRSVAFTPDGTRLIAAGEDKHTLVWRRQDELDATRRWQFERAIRWQVQRGPLGHILSLSATPELLAMAGHGAMGGHSEIWLVDNATGQWRSTLIQPDNAVGDRDVITGMQFVQRAGETRLVSADRRGEITAWTRGEQGWQGKVIVPSDTQQFGRDTAQRLESYRGFAPVAVIGNFAVAQQWKAFAEDGAPDWTLVRAPIDGSGPPVALVQDGPVHVGLVTAMAVAEEPGFLASADGAGKLTLWQLRGKPQFKTMQLDGPALALNFSQNGARLLVCTALGDTTKTGTWQVWNTTNPLAPQRLRSEAQSQHVRAGSLTPDGRYAAVAVGSRLEVHDLAAQVATFQSLEGNIQVPTKVAFPTQPDDHRLLIQGRTPGSSAITTQVFDTRAVQLNTLSTTEPSIDAGQWTSETRGKGDWKFRVDNEPGLYWLERSNARAARRGRIQFSPAYDGQPTAICWVPDRQGNPFAVALAMGGQNNIYVYRLGDRGDCPLLRQFRGHGARIDSMSVAADRRFLASASADGTTKVWNLDGIDVDDPQLLLWGARFVVEDNQLVVRDLRHDSPLHFRGLRAGDVISRLQWIELEDYEQARAHDRESQRWRSLESAHEMSRTLERNNGRTPMVFTYDRGRDLRKAFQSLPAWQPLVSVVISVDHEWAYFTEAGYYDSSFEGHRLFGWQFNRGLYLEPDFFLAAQLRASLERPEIMSRLLEAGNLEDAFRIAQRDVPANPQYAIVGANRLRPHIHLLSPQDSQTIDGTRLTVEAYIDVPIGQTLVPPKAFANGVVAAQRELLRQETVEFEGVLKDRYTYRWECDLPSDPELLIQVIASTDDELADEVTVQLARNTYPRRKRSRLYLVSAGINHYRDRQVQSLDFAVNNALQFSTTLMQRASGRYEMHSLALLDERMTRPMWDFAMDQCAESLRTDVQPDDLLIVFLSGHGIRDPEDETYYYLTADSRLSDVLARQYEDCLSFQDFARFADIPCRKLVVLDTCHSGAVLPLGQRELKAAIRALQSDMIMTLTASQGNQEAAEVRQRQLGRFTYHLLAGLRGAADEDQNAEVTLPEVASYVQRMVEQESAGDAVPQIPTAGPADLLRYARVPVSRRAAADERREAGG